MILVLNFPSYDSALCESDVEAYLTDAFWYDVGSTEKYEKLGNDLVDGLFKV